jgi:hypothetical protein
MCRCANCSRLCQRRGGWLIRPRRPARRAAPLRLGREFVRQKQRSGASSRADRWGRVSLAPLRWPKAVWDHSCFAEEASRFRAAVGPFGFSRPFRCGAARHRPRRSVFHCRRRGRRRSKRQRPCVSRRAARRSASRVAAQSGHGRPPCSAGFSRPFRCGAARHTPRRSVFDCRRRGRRRSKPARPSVSRPASPAEGRMAHPPPAVGAKRRTFASDARGAREEQRTGASSRADQSTASEGRLQPGFPMRCSRR